MKWPLCPCAMSHQRSIKFPIIYTRMWVNQEQYLSMHAYFDNPLSFEHHSSLKLYVFSSASGWSVSWRIIFLPTVLLRISHMLLPPWQMYSCKCFLAKRMPRLPKLVWLERIIWDGRKKFVIQMKPFSELDMLDPCRCSYPSLCLFMLHKIGL